jgi:hypothetical protein
MLDKLTLDARLTQRPSEIEVTYTITNGRDEDVGVFNRLQGIGVDGGLMFSPDAVFVDLEGSLLRLSKMALPVPKGLRITAYTPPFASRVPAGESFTETFVLKIPVKVQQPFKRALIQGEVAAVKPETAKECELSLGVFPCSDGVRLVSEHPAYPDVLTAVPPDPAVKQQVVIAQRLALSADVAVLDYVGFPWS